MPSTDDYYQRLEDEAKKHGATPEPSWRQDLERTYQGSGGQGSRSSEDVFNSIFSKQAARGSQDPPQQDDRSEGNSGSSGGNTSEAYRGYLNTPNPAHDALLATIQQMQAQAAEEKARRDAERAALREIMTSRLKTAQEPVSTESPGIRDVIAARRLESQRGSERSRAALAERLHAQGMGNSGLFDAGVLGLEQDRGEADSDAVAEILHGELSAKRQELMQLLQMAAAMGDADATRAIQQQLAILDTQMQQTSLSEGGRRFDEDLGFRESSFMNDLGYRLLALELAGNQAGGNFGFNF